MTLAFVCVCVRSQSARKIASALLDSFGSLKGKRGSNFHRQINQMAEMMVIGQPMDDFQIDK